MKLPDWRTLKLADGVLAEPVAENDRIVLWVRGQRVNGVQEWERINTVARAEITVDEQICSVAAQAIQARQRSAGILGRMLRRFRASTGQTTWLLPNGASAEQTGPRQSDMLLAWVENGQSLDQSQVAARWPNYARVHSLAQGLFAVFGFESPVAPPQSATPLPEGSPLQMAERLLQAARNQPDRGRLVTALTDLGILLSGEGKCDRAIALLEEALAAARQLGDRAKERDVLGNLGTAVAGKNPRRALALLQEELALAQESGDPFARKTALAHLGVFYLRARLPAEALAPLTDARRLAVEAGDRQHEAELLWLLAIGHAELGERGQAEVDARAAVELLQAMGKPQAKVLAEHLAKFQAQPEGGRNPVSLEKPGFLQPAGFSGEFTVGGGWGAEPESLAAGESTAGGPSWLRMGYSAAKALAKFVGSGMKRVPRDVYQQRLTLCAGCEHHTGLRCKLCGCFTGVKAWLPREECPARKWPAV